MDAINWAAVFIATIAALGSLATARTSAKATTVNSETNARVEMEKEAYDRARTLDTGTIKRQKKEVEELREENRQLKEMVRKLEERVALLEKEIRNEDH